MTTTPAARTILTLCACTLSAGCYENFSAPVILTEEGETAYNSALAVDAADWLHSVEAQKVGSDQYQLIWRQSFDQGATWTAAEHLDYSVNGGLFQDLEMATDPDDPDRLYVVYADGDNVRFKRSISGGEWWYQSEVLGEHGQTPRHHLAIDPDDPADLCLLFMSDTWLVSRSSGNGGVTWDEKVYVDTYSNWEPSWTQLLDAEYAPDGALLCLYWRFYGGFSRNPHIELVVVRSDDNGHSWSNEIQVATVSGSDWEQIQDGLVTAEADLLTVGDRVYVLWHRFDLAMLGWSDDDGLSWDYGAPTIVAPKGTDGEIEEIRYARLATSEFSGELLLGISSAPADASTSLNLYQRTWSGSSLGAWHRVNDEYGRLKRRAFSLAADSDSRIFAKWTQRIDFDYTTLVSSFDPLAPELYSVEIGPESIVGSASAGGSIDLFWDVGNWGWSATELYTSVELIDAAGEVWTLFSFDDLPVLANAVYDLAQPLELPLGAAKGQCEIVATTGFGPDDIRDSDSFALNLN